MELIIKILWLLVFLTLFIGLLNPKLILFWKTNPKRKSFFFLWVLFLIFVIFISYISTYETKDEQDLAIINKIEVLIEQKSYSEAISLTKSISDSSNFKRHADSLIAIINSLTAIQFRSDSIHRQEALNKAMEEVSKETINNLKFEINEIKRGIDYSQYRGSYVDLNTEINRFIRWHELYSDNLNSSDSEIKSLAKTLQKLSSQVQSKEFPLIRKEYARIANNKLWENDMYAKCSGSGNVFFNISGGVFAANKNIQDFQNEIESILLKYRFKQSRYRWYKEADEYSYYTVYTGKDSDPVTPY